jgi:hypothetical protein
MTVEDVKVHDSAAPNPVCGEVLHAPELKLMRLGSVSVKKQLELMAFVVVNVKV